MMCLKIYHISPIKLKTRVFHRLHTHEVTHKNASEAQSFSQEAFSHETVARQLRKSFSEFCVFTILP